MSNVIKILIVVVVLAGGASLVMWSGVLKPKPVVTTAPPVQPVTAPAPAPAPQPEMNMNGMAAANDANDAALVQDMAAIDTQIQGLTTDSASVDSSLNDKPMSQAY